MMHLGDFYKRNLKLCYFIALFTPLFIALVSVFGLNYQISRFNNTYSLPHGLFITNPFEAPIKCGDYIVFNHIASPDRVIKKVLGVEGDVIGHNANRVWVHEQQLTLKSTRRNGTILTPLKTSVVPKGMVFVAGEHVDSFDSRYEEFGLVPLSDVRGRVWPVL